MTKIYTDSKNRKIVDTPGYNDTRGIEIEIAN